MQRNLFVTYTGMFVFVVGWWLLAFRHPVADEPLLASRPSSLPEAVAAEELPLLIAPPDRTKIREALAGDAALMAELIRSWDLDAELLESRGFSPVRRLPRAGYLKSQTIGRMLTQGSQEQLNEAREKARSGLVVDALGQPHDLSRCHSCFLPQTYASASILLALVEPKQIAALPLGYREQSEICSEKECDAVPIDLSFYQTEKIYLAKPQVAFVSHTYSHPDAIKALKSQGMHIFSHGDMILLQEIKESILRIGHIVNRPLKAELLTLFIDAAMAAIDNAYALSQENRPSGKALVVAYHHQFSLPGSKSLTHILLKNMQIDNHAIARHIHDWSIPVQEEQIVHYNPDKLIIIGENNYPPNIFFAMHPSLERFKKEAVFLNGVIQNSPTQYFVLAYYDLNRALQAQ